MKLGIPATEFALRVENLQRLMIAEGIGVCFVYGDEYRRENLRYMCNFWPMFERGAVIVPSSGEPIVLAAPEGEMVCREMSAWKDIRVIQDFACVTVPDVILFPRAEFTTLKAVFDELKVKCGYQKVGITGLDAMPESVHAAVAQAAGVETVDANSLLYKLRLKKTVNEINCLKEAARITDIGFQALINALAPGKTEQELAAIGCYEAMKAGAEYIPFCNVSSGARVNTIIGRPTGKVIGQGEIVLAALAVQFEGYIATIGFPLMAGKPTREQGRFMDLIVQASEIALSNLKAGGRMGTLVSSVKDYFKNMGVSQYDLYPPMHGCGVAEAESPYPNEYTDTVFEAGMTVNSDISLFGHPCGAGRIEESLVVTADGYEPMSALTRRLSKEWMENIKDFHG